MEPIFRAWFTQFQAQIRRRLGPNHHTGGARPAFTARSIDYDVAHRDRAIAFGDIGAVHLLVQQLGLADAIDRHLHVLQIHLPYHESDHVLNIAYNALRNGTCLGDIEHRRTDEAFLDALGARRLPDPTTAGDFCRRLGRSDITALHDAVDEVRLATPKSITLGTGRPSYTLNERNRMRSAVVRPSTGP